MDHYLAPPRGQRPPGDFDCADIAGVAALDDVRAFLASQGLAAPTPLVALPGLAAELGMSRLDVKDESARMGLNSFKALGGAYAVAKLVLEAAAQQLGVRGSFDELAAAEVRGIAGAMTFACATDGNHGRAVALGARICGAKTVVFVHEGVAAARRERLERDGARVLEVAGAYDDAVDEAREACAANDWRLVSDTAWDGYERVPALVMCGYGVLVDEALGGLAAPPTHVFVQAGVGGLAAAVAAQLICAFDAATRPRLIVVEPARAACLLQSARAGRVLKLAAGEPTSMALLECYQPSLTAWRILGTGADGYLAVSETRAEEAASRFERPAAGDPALATSESGAAGLAGLLQAAADPQLRRLIGLDAGSRVLLINSERGLERGAVGPA